MEVDKGCPMIRMGVSGWVFLLVPAYPGSPGPNAVKRLCVLLLQLHSQATQGAGYTLQSNWPVSMLSLTIQFPVTSTASHCMTHPCRGTSITSPGTRVSEQTTSNSTTKPHRQTQASHFATAAGAILPASQYIQRLVKHQELFKMWGTESTNSLFIKFVYWPFTITTTPA